MEATIIYLFKTYGILAGLGLLFLAGFFFKVMPMVFDAVNRFISVIEKIGDKVEQAADKTSADLAGIMTEFRTDRINMMAEFKNDRETTRNAHKLEVENQTQIYKAQLDAVMSSNQKILDSFIEVSARKLIVEK